MRAISTEYRKKLVEEMIFIANQLEGELAPREKSYFLSAVPAMINRIFNLEYHEELVLLHIVFQGLHGQLEQLITNIESGTEKTIALPDEYFPKLAKLLRDIAAAIGKKEDLYPYLTSASIFLYVLTGNGFYLYRRGVLSLD